MLNSMRNFFAIKLPHHQIFAPNPIWDFELRRVKRLSTPARLRAYVLVMCLIFGIFPVAFYASWIDRLTQQYYSNSGYGYYYGGAEVYIYGIFALWGVSFLALFVADIYALAVTVGGINSYRDSGHWELLKLTSVDEEDVISAKQGIGQLRAWRIVGIEIGLRFSLVALIFAIFVLPAYPTNTTTILQSMIDGLVEQPLQVIMGFLTIAALLIFYTVEPYWRMQTMVNIGVSISARTKNQVMVALSAFGSVIGVRVSQIVISIGLLWFFGIISAIFYRLYGSSINYNYDLWNNISAIYVFLCTLIYIFVAYMYYFLVRNRATRMAEKALFKPE